MSNSFLRRGIIGISFPIYSPSGKPHQADTRNIFFLYYVWLQCCGLISVLLGQNLVTDRLILDQLIEREGIKGIALHAVESCKKSHHLETRFSESFVFQQNKASKTLYFRIEKIIFVNQKAIITAVIITAVIIAKVIVTTVRIKLIILLEMEYHNHAQ